MFFFNSPHISGQAWEDFVGEGSLQAQKWLLRSWRRARNDPLRIPPRISLRSGGVPAKIYKKLNTFYRDPVEKKYFPV